MNKPVLQIKDVQKIYGTGQAATKVLRGINIHIETGEFVIIFGPSGAGKSTLLNIINGLETPTTGTIVVDTQDLNTLTEQERARFHRQTIGMVFQAYNLIPYLSVLDNITLPLLFAKISPKERDRRGLVLLKEFGLVELAHRLPTEISGGQAQRVGIMRALISDPPIIVADEPTGNLDTVATKSVMDLFLELNKVRHNTLIVVTHDQTLFRYADRIIHILDGSVVKEIVKKGKPVKETVHDSVYQNLLQKTKDPIDLHLIKTLEVLLTKHQLDTFDEDELLLTIEFLKQRRANKINKEELYHALDKPREDGGAGLYEPTAKHLSENFENILEIIK